ncbi:hypothetical protein DB30_04014 [Enhygromyxa salina]|uniref:Uncharacterized protein n=1 Tax=Enhygromyxa salina TaxID=215803 RepID=A0A0C2DAC5_9BACT|nr:hypothetical protein [Enhygromyxa salina]KIG16852.1 hypothetical protein DB30_04014 [Enhygromyxa salina]
MTPTRSSTTAPLVVSLLLAVSLAQLGCGEEPSPGETLAGTGSDTGTDTATNTSADTDTGTDTGGEELETAVITHRFGEYTLDPFEEVQPCVQWTVDNDDPIYLQAVTLSNLGYFHHSNWFVVPESLFAGPDGYFKCSDRNFDELGAASVGTVVFAQSTQSFVEEQRTGPGAVIKLPARYKVIGSTHMLNVGPAAISTDLFMSFELIHPRDVDIVLAPFRLTYYDLDIPANAKSHFTGICDDFASDYEALTGGPLDLKLHYVLPHYHYLGDYFDLTVLGGPLNGTSVHSLNGFNGEANGKTFDPPLDLAGATGLKFTCGYDNWRDVNVGWGIGDQEMCVMLGLAETEILMDITVNGGSMAVGQTDGVLEYEAACNFFGIPKDIQQTLPTASERNGPFNVPPSGDEGVPPVPACVDHNPNVQPSLAPTLANVEAAVFQPSCMFNACHGSSGQAAGLDLQSPNLLAELLGHQVQGNPGASLVEPGDPDSSWLYQVMSSCEPQGDGGGIVAHMPRNAPVLLNDDAVALVREWIAAGAMP